MAWCKGTSEILHNKKFNTTQSKEKIRNNKRIDETIEYEYMSCNTLENLKNYLKNTLNLTFDIEMDYNNKSTVLSSSLYDVDQECNSD